ncbi:hypothetical protein GA0061102_104730 [Rhizobium miluonense]|uniref:Uncharacterized protein n=1 Tax=Rhizobium miluonense TaxID=411945 RepID=A0A1C3WZJ0_9HYPH|nr:hypothetical protein GA0061102_104730 [Rhizobium miluonense]
MQIFYCQALDGIFLLKRPTSVVFRMWVAAAAVAAPQLAFGRQTISVTVSFFGTIPRL